MRQDVIAAWQRVEEVWHPEVINRMGLRYINRITKETAQDRPSTWFAANDYISAGFLRSGPGFLLREELHLDAENILIITLGDPQSDADGGHGVIIFDLDRIGERELSRGQEVSMQDMDR